MSSDILNRNFGDHPNYYPPEFFAREDESQDDRFYDSPRLVVHIDDHAISAISQVYGELIPAGSTVLDLMSSWKSHYPATLMQSKSEIVGHGMNEVELRENKQLDRYFVQNLNDNPTLPLPDNYFDVVTNTVSVQYLTRPIEVFREVRRVLKPGGQYIVAFSNRMFPTKAVAVWRYLGEAEHVTLVESYFEYAGGYDDSRHIIRRDEAKGMRGWLGAGDPAYIVVGRKE